MKVHFLNITENIAICNIGENPAYLYPVNISDNVRKYRKARGLTQEELGGLMGMKQSMIASYERGLRKVPVEKIPEFAQTLSVSLDELFGLKDKPPGTPVVHIHKNKREAKIQELFAQLSPANQRAILMQIRGALAAKGHK